ncbi:hypothetical protein MMC17_009953 [Xylographa soralifera]|nr:hypothetical protein [Xylographa soralifera]
MNLPANTALFWTQSTKHNEFADQNNLYTLEKACGYYVDSDHKSSPLYPTASLTRSTGAPVWDALSHAMAVAAKGTVYVMKGPGAEAKPTSTWNRIEFPALKANREVTSIIELSDDATKLTDGHVIWSVSKTPPGSQPGSQPGSPKDLSKVSPVGKSSSLPASPKGLPAKVLHRRNLLQAVRASQGYY